MTTHNVANLIAISNSTLASIIPPQLQSIHSFIAHSSRRIFLHDTTVPLAYLEVHTVLHTNELIDADSVNATSNCSIVPVVQIDNRAKTESYTAIQYYSRTMYSQIKIIAGVSS